MASSLTRREFLIGSSVLASGAALGHLVPKQKAEPVVAGFIGVGAQGQEVLKRCLRVPGVEMAGICDVYEPHLNQALKLCGGTPTAYKDYRKLLEDKRIQAVLIATPLYLHAPMAIAAMQAGKHVFCEKCMARHPEQAREMARTVGKTGKWLQIGHQRASSALYQHARRQVAEEQILGKLTHVRALWHRNGSWRRNVPKEFERLLNWRLYKEYSGGLMTELGSHQIHLVNWFTGENPVAVHGYGGIDYWKDGREVFDNVCVTFLYPGGKKVMYSSLTTNQFDGFGELFMGDKGTLQISTDKGLVYKEPAAEPLDWAGDAKKEKVGGREAIVLDASATKKNQPGQREQSGVLSSDNMDDYMAEIQQFFDDTVRSNKRPLCDHVEGLRACVTVLGANRAMETGTEVRFKPSDFQF